MKHISKKAGETNRESERWRNKTGKSHLCFDQSTPANKLWPIMAARSSRLKCHVCNFNKWISLVFQHAPCDVFMGCRGDREENVKKSSQAAMITELAGHLIFCPSGKVESCRQKQRTREQQHYLSSNPKSRFHRRLLTSGKKHVALFLALTLRVFYVLKTGNVLKQQDRTSCCCMHWDEETQLDKERHTQLIVHKYKEKWVFGLQLPTSILHYFNEYYVWWIFPHTQQARK